MLNRLGIGLLLFVPAAVGPVIAEERSAAPAVGADAETMEEGDMAAGEVPQWDSIRGAVDTVGEPGPHWFLARGRHIGYVFDGDSGEVQGTMTLSLFTPALEPDLDRGMIYSYGSFYSRTYYGERTDVVLFFDAETMKPVDEVEVPPKTAGIGHSGMIGLVDDRFLGVWNITPAMSVSLVDVEDREFVDEISTPGCAGVYPVGSGFLMPCGDGALQYIALGEDGTETDRMRSEVFFDVQEDPIFDYAVPTAEGWLFMSFDGMVYEATLDEQDGIQVSQGWSIFTTDDSGERPEGEQGWRIGGRQPFAYNAELDQLVTLMHEGGGQETFEDPGTEIWAYNVSRETRGYRRELESPSRGVLLTRDDEPLLLVSADESEDVYVHDGTTGGLEHTIEEGGGGLLQNF